MQVFSRTILAFGAILTAALCLAQSPLPKPKPQPQPVAAKPCCRVVLLFKSTAAAPGEPVPGAEILIEQEPDTVARVMTDSNGAGTFALPASGKVKITVKLAAKPIGQLKKKAPQAEKVQLILRVTGGKKTTEHSADVRLANPSEVTAGPFSQSLSNIEDNG